ncbi:MAG TPA: hypothetical protein VEY30_11460, partial [Myxococcaceae bacterium]|nr:hypothetical protein [Myxococcaceae bacterium]
GACVAPEPTPDAGGTPDAGDPEVSCTPECGSGFRCNSQPAGGGACEPLYIAVTGGTVTGAGAASRAVLFRYGDAATEVELTPAGTVSKFPRFGPDGQAVVFVAGGAPAAAELRVVQAPFSPASASVVPLEPAGVSSDFPDLEWAPADALLWRNPTAAAVSTGILWAPVTGGAPVRQTFIGGLPTWSPDGQQVAYAVSGATQEGTGVYLAPRAQAATGKSEGALRGGTQGGEEPYFSPSGALLLYRRSAGGTGREDDEIWIASTTGADAPVRLTTSIPYSPEPRVAGSYFAFGTWSPDGRWVAYTRVNYSPTGPGGGAVICGNEGSNCPPGTPGQQVIAQRVNPTTGQPEGEPVVVEAVRGALPSFSPDGRLIAYISAGSLRVKSFGENGEVSAAPLFEKRPASGPISTSASDDSRPRWQPYAR